MEHLFDDEERKVVSSELDTFRWLNFDHDFPQEYDLLPLEEYPIVRGWSQQDIARLKTEPANNFEDLGLLQSWLFFGVLETVLGAPVSSEVFLRNTHGRGYVLDTTALRDILGGLKTCLLEEWRSDPVQMNKFTIGFERAIRFSIIWNRILINQSRSPFLLQKIFDSVVRSSALLGESLYALHEFLLEDAVEAFPDVVWHLTSSTKVDLHKRLVDRGWCRSAFPAADALHLSVLYYAALYPSEEQAIDSKHGNCNEEKCLINDIDVSSYKPKHTMDCQMANCVNVAADLSQLKECLGEGQVPIVDAAQIFLTGSSPSEDIVLPIIRHVPGTLYVAFSHVWAHGRGSTAENGLPFCQMKFLLKTMLTPNPSLNIYTPYLWIDSLCIPEEKEPRSRAIQLMSSIYSEASVTMVLDDGMQKLKPNVSPDYFLLRLLLSDWNRRLWTLQEATLSTNLHVVTSSGLVSLRKQAIESYKSPVRTAVSLRISSWFLRFIMKEFRTILHIALLLSHRSSSKRSDEALALAPMLGVNPRPLIPLSGDERMAALWRSIREVPRSVLFMGTHQRNSVPGYGWAPRTLMTKEGIVDTTEISQSCIVTEKGLKATFLILRFKETVKLPNSTSSLLKAVNSSSDLAYLITGTESTGGHAISADAILVQHELLPDTFQPAISLLKEADDPEQENGDEIPRYRYQALRGMTITKSSDTRSSVLGLKVEEEVVDCNVLETLEIIIS